MALWFCDSFGLDLLSIVFSSKENDVISLTYGNMPSEENPGTNADTTLQTVFLLDRFGISYNYNTLQNLYCWAGLEYRISFIINSQ